MTKVKQNKEKKILIRLSEDIDSKFRQYCNDNGISMSKRLRLFIEKDLDGKLIIKK